MVTKLLGPHQILELCERHGIRTRKGFGQHFLADPNTVRKIVALAGLRSDQTVLEIGPGIGSLTIALAEAASNVIAVEIDTDVLGALREVAAGNVEVRNIDALGSPAIDYAPDATVLCSNLPYNVATPILIHVLRTHPGICGGVVMVQTEVAQRWVAAPGSRIYGAPSVKLQQMADLKIVAKVPPSVFFPPPKVNSALVGFTRTAARPVASLQMFDKLVESAFGQRRKTILNSLRPTFPDAAAALEAAGIENTRRPETLNVGEWIRLTEASA